MSLVRRARGTLLRLVRRRMVAVIVGAVLLLPAVWVQLRGMPFWWAEGLSMVAGGTGAALIWTGLAGSRPDWIDDERTRG